MEKDDIVGKARRTTITGVWRRRMILCGRQEGQQLRDRRGAGDGAEGEKKNGTGRTDKFKDDSMRKSGVVG